MEFNSSIYFNQYTFQTDFPPSTFVPPPPAPPNYFIPPVPPQIDNKQWIMTDQEFIKSFESRITMNEHKFKCKLPSITEVKDGVYKLMWHFNEINNKRNFLNDNIETMSEEQWRKTMMQVQENKIKFNEYLSHYLSSDFAERAQKAVTKRAAKRARLKRMRLELKKAKAKSVEQQKEKSRKIDEYLQKIKDDIERANQEEDAKLQADVVLKDVIRKKHDAKKCCLKLDALLKLRKARQNTAKGRGQNVSKTEELSFEKNIEKLRALWRQKLIVYEKEENDLREKLKTDNNIGTEVTYTKNEKLVIDNLKKWREIMFGAEDILPQVDFKGDVDKFIAIRAEWDQYISDEGSSMPVGWVVPTKLFTS